MGGSSPGGMTATPYNPFGNGPSPAASLIGRLTGPFQPQGIQSPLANLPLRPGLELNSTQPFGISARQFGAMNRGMAPGSVGLLGY
jgi:hypothetical protein